MPRSSASFLFLALALGAAAALPAAATAAAQGGGRIASGPARLPGPPAASVDAAVTAPLTRYNRHIKGGAHTSQAGVRGGAPFVLALAAMTGDTSADARLLEQIRYTLTGGNDITANGGYPAQHERNVTAMFALVRRTPRVWSRLTPAETARIDLLMKAALVASAFTTSDDNPYILGKSQQHALDGDANLGRDWNPNYREGMVGMLLVAAAYFGGGDRVTALLANYDHAAFVRELQQSGLSNLHETFTWKAAHPESEAPTGAMIEKAVRRYRYRGVPATETMTLYRLLTEDTYGKTVNCGLNGGAGVALPDGSRAGMLPSGCESLPNKGKPGMLKEFDSVDAGGPRSATHYAYDGFRVNLINHLTLVATGLWKPGADADACLARLRVGIPDLWYKIERGYRNYDKGRASGVFGAGTPAGGGFPFTRPLWEEVARPYHGLPR